MKKIIFAALSVLMMLSLVGCGEHLVDFKVIDLSSGAVPGDWAIPANWDNTTPFTSVDKDNNTYTFEFTVKDDLAEGAEVGFKILTVNGDWNVAGYTEFEVTVDGEAATANYKDNCGPAGNAFVKGCEAGKTYKMTVVCNSDSTATVSVVSMADPVYPTPFWLDGYYAMGPGGNFTAGPATLLCNGDFDVTTGIIVYTKDFKASKADENFGIATSDWGTKYVSGTFTIGTDTDYVATTLAGDSDNFIKGMTVGNPYRLYVKVTPEKEVSFKVEEICEVTFKFEVTNMGENTDAWMNGTFWGSWSNGWKQESWYKTDSSNKFSDKLSDPTVADGVATFDEKWNVDKVAKPNDVLKFTFKTQVTKDDWSDDSKCSSPDKDQTLEFKVTKSGTVKVSVNASDWKVTAKYVD